MELKNNVVLPEQIQKALQEVSESTPRNADALHVFVGIPCMGELHIGLVMKLFDWARNPRYRPFYQFAIEKRPIDHARNYLVGEFMNTKCEWFVMVDSDVDPHSDLLELAKHNKDIIAAKTHCWIKNSLLASVWQKAECEQCRCLDIYLKEGKVHDKTQYRIADDYFWRWDPAHQEFARFANKKGILPGMKCRCKGTGLDPWVFRSWSKEVEEGKIFKCDSVGTASIVIKRKVIEGMNPPHFCFYYRPTREILLTEDHYFCWKAQECGFQVWADMDMTCQHYKAVNLVAVEQIIVKAFLKGREYQDQQGKKEIKIIEPTLAEIAEVDESKNLPEKEEPLIVLANK